MLLFTLERLPKSSRQVHGVFHGCHPTFQLGIVDAVDDLREGEPSLEASLDQILAADKRLRANSALERCSNVFRTCSESDGSTTDTRFTAD